MKLSEFRSAPNLATQWLGRDWRFFAQTGSTNDDAKAAAEAGAPHGTVVIADAQTRGRGRLGRSWHAAPGENLTFSVLVRPEVSPAEAPPITLAAGIAVAEAVASLGVSDIRLKWPNDVVVGDRKLAGILTEMASDSNHIRFVVIGVGINVNSIQFPEPMAHTATSLRLLLGHDTDRTEFLARLCEQLETWLDRLFVQGFAAIAEHRFEPSSPLHQS